MKKRVRAIIFADDRIILMRREKAGREYFVFPGGLVEEGESKEEALRRECREELGIEIRAVRLIKKQDLTLYADKQREYFYLCEKTGGVLGTGDGPEYQDEKGYWGAHEPAAVPREKIKDLKLLPKNVKGIVENLK
ncbi:MAG: NUDIX domain-containing protein [Candidatus Moranbacteria bacterium]|nr:NUDIX domain-containing protein [Candidatus Moranbacteria bacterium]